MNKTLKKVLKWTGIAAAAIFIFVAGFATYIHFKGIPTYEPKDLNIAVEVTPERIAHGKKMVITTCANCHLNKETGRLTGGLLKDLPPGFGPMYSRNVTRHKEEGIG